VEEQFKILREQQEQQSVHVAEKVCHSCSFKNDAGALFCEHCGKELDTPGRRCPECGEFCSGECCGFCGAIVDGYTCSSCGAVSYRDFCPECGTPGTDRARELLAPDPEAPAIKQVLQEQEVEEIKKSMFSDLSEEVLKEIERGNQRIIYMKEMEYARERDRRIDNYISSTADKSVRTINKDEMVRIKETIERMRLFNKDEKARNDEEIRIREEEEARRLEEERLKREKEQKAREEEERRIAEERKRREEERKREELVDVVNGKWLFKADWGYCILEFKTGDGKRIHGTTFISCPIGENVNKISGNLQNNNISFYVSSCSGRECQNHAIMKFSGSISGSMMNGYMNYMKTVDQGIFVKIK
jgi:hypothetical protein